MKPFSRVGAVAWMLAGCLLGSALAGDAGAQPFPSRPLRLIVPFPPGGPSDISARAVADGVQEALGQPMVVENRPGAGAVVGTQALLATPPDGHTLLMASNVISTGKWLFKTLPFDPLRDLRAVMGVSTSPHLVVVAPAYPASGINEFIRVIKSKGGKANYASGGTGTMPHLGAELFKQVTGVDMAHVPYKGSGPALPAVMAGEVDVYFDILLSAAALVKGGKLKTLGVTSLVRSPQFPDVPTLDEQGIKGYELNSWFGIVTHATVPDAVVAQLNQGLNRSLQRQAVRERLATLGATAIGGPPQAFQKMIESDYNVWGQVIRKAGITAE